MPGPKRDSGPLVHEIRARHRIEGGIEERVALRRGVIGGIEGKQKNVPSARVNSGQDRNLHPILHIQFHHCILKPVTADNEDVTAAKLGAQNGRG